MKKKMASLVLLCLLSGLLAGCGSSTQQTETSGSAEKTQQTQETQETVTAAALHEETEGPDVVVDGTQLTGACIRAHGTAMVPAEEWASLFGAEYKLDASSGAISLSWGGKSAELTLDETEAVFDGETETVEAPYCRDDGTVVIPAKAVSEFFCAGVLKRSGTLYITPYAGNWTMPEGVNVPVLEYHAVSDDCWGITELFVSPSSMEEQLQYLCDNGYTTITFDDLYRVDEIEKPVLLTFDDGYEDNYDNLFPLLQKYQCKATIFLIAGGLGTHYRMTAEQAREMSDSGLVSIQSHTYTHCDLSSLSSKAQRQEMKESSRAILDATGRQPFALCYPFGCYNDDTLDADPEQFRFGITTESGCFNTSNGRYQIPRLYIARDTDLDTFAYYASMAD